MLALLRRRKNKRMADLIDARMLELLATQDRDVELEIDGALLLKSLKKIKRERGEGLGLD